MKKGDKLRLIKKYDYFGLTIGKVYNVIEFINILPKSTNCQNITYVVIKRDDGDIGCYGLEDFVNISEGRRNKLNRLSGYESDM